ncbi:nicotinate-nucleotide--dimethylbenzimidazole phosphoribosyltransferase [Streptomyces sp. NPDC002004]
MTDTGQVPGEGLPENAGEGVPPGPVEGSGAQQPGVQAPGAYTYLEPSATPTEEDDLLLMPGAQGAWTEGPGPHETAGRDTGSVELGGGQAHVPPHAQNPGPARRPLHLGPPLPDGASSPVRSLADRGPARPASTPAPGPEYFDAAPGTPWGTADETAPVTPVQDRAGQGPGLDGVPPVTPESAAQHVIARVAGIASDGAVPPVPEGAFVPGAEGAAQAPQQGDASGQFPVGGAAQVPQAADVSGQFPAAGAAAQPQTPDAGPTPHVPEGTAPTADEAGVPVQQTPADLPLAGETRPVSVSPDAPGVGDAVPAQAGAEAPSAQTAEAAVPPHAAAPPEGLPVTEQAEAPHAADAAPQDQAVDALQAEAADTEQTRGQAVDAAGAAQQPPSVDEAGATQAVEGVEPAGALDEAPLPDTAAAEPEAVAGSLTAPAAEAAAPAQAPEAAQTPPPVAEPQVQQSAPAEAHPQVVGEAASQTGEAVVHPQAVAPEYQPVPVGVAHTVAASGPAFVDGAASYEPVAAQPEFTAVPPHAAPRADGAVGMAPEAHTLGRFVPVEGFVPTTPHLAPTPPHALRLPNEGDAMVPDAPQDAVVPEAQPEQGLPLAPDSTPAAGTPAADDVAPGAAATAAPADLPAPAAPGDAPLGTAPADQGPPTPEAAHGDASLDAAPAEAVTAPVAQEAPATPEAPVAAPDQDPGAPAPAPEQEIPARAEQEIPVRAEQGLPAPEPTAAAPAPEPEAAVTVPAPRDGDDPAPAAGGTEAEEPEPVLAQDAESLTTQEADDDDAPEVLVTAQDAPAEPVGTPAPGYADAEREAVLRVMRERRDIRNGFRDDPIPHEVLLRVLEAAHTAPSVGHSQPWDFVVIRSAETRRTMHELAMRQRDAYAKSLPKGRAKQFKELKIEAILDTPVNIVVTADPTRGGRHTLGRHTQPQMAPYSSALAVENLWLAARAEGLGVGWVSFFDEREMVRSLGLPEHLEVVAYLCVGYVDEFPDEPELMQAGWSKRRPLSWVVHEETYGRRALPGEEPHDLLAETVAGIRPLDAKALGEAWERQKRMTKPAGALGMLEIISAQLCGLSRMCPPPIPEPAAVAIFAGDHGVHAQGVTPWPQEVTGQMVANFLGGGAVCNAFANQVGAEVCVIDVGVASDLPSTPGLLPRKVRAGTNDMTTGPALTREEVKAAIEVGIETARDLVAAGNKALLTGEMGIANTTASAALISVFTGTDPSEVTGRGTGINDETLARKTEVVRRAIELHQPDPADPIGVLAAFGGLEHAAMVGLLLGGASLRTPVILDGVSAGAAALVARAIAPEVLAACIAGHRSAEPGHVAALKKLGLRPLVDLDLRLGEGTGALLALPIVQSAARAMHEVATFDSAGVTEK